MITRRKFLQSNMVGLTLPLVGVDTLRAAVPSDSAAAQSESCPVPAGNPGDRDYWNDWPKYLTSKMNEARGHRLAELRTMRSAADVRARIHKIRSTVWKLVGGHFDKTPLKPQITGTINRGSYRVEKLIFQSHPGIYVTSNLYVPNGGHRPYPGVVAPLGHTENGKSYRNYQYVYQTLARKGYVVLAFDPFGQGERLQYLNSRTGKGYLGPTESHNEAGRPILLFGSTLAQYRAWDGIRAVDYLLSRSDVDPQKIGCAGHSGGATMTMYLCALEPRIKVAVEVDGNSENLAGPSYLPPGGIADAEQDLIFSLPHGIDRGDLLMAFAPKPLMMIYTPIDRGTTYSPTYLQGTREVHNEVHAAYQLMGSGEKVGIFETSLPHDWDFFSRRATYGWLNRWLGSESWGTEEAPFDESAPGALDCTPTGQVLTSLGGRTIYQLSADRLKKILPPNPLGDTLSDTRAFSTHARTTLHELLALPAEKGPLNSRIYSSHTREKLHIEEFVFHSEPSIRVTGWFLKPVAGSGPFPTILHVSEGNKNTAIIEWGELCDLARKGYAVCAIDMRGLGDSIRHYPPAGPNFYYVGGEHLHEGYDWACFTLGKPALGQRVWDCLRCLDYLESRPDVDRSRVHGLGEQGAGLAILLAAVLDHRLHSILLDSMIATYRSIVESKAYNLKLSWFLYGVLLHYDLPDLVGSLAPRRCWLLNASNPVGEPLPESKLSDLYKNAIETFKRANAEEELRLLVRKDAEKSNVLERWLRAVALPANR